MRQKADLAATLLASLSHDLKTPLTAIRIAVENLSGDLPPADRREQADAAITELDRLTRLLQDILDMARIDAGGDPRRSPMGDRGRRRGCRGGPRPARARSARAARPRRGRRERRDRSALASVALSHLLENAALYSPRRSGIDVEAQVEADGLRVSVTDHGPGLDPGELDHLFERFYRGRTARQSTFGTGMGLSITRGLLAAAGGRVWAENVPGAGARFTDRRPGRRRGRDGGALMAARILVVDDEPNILATVAPLLRGRGYDVMSAMTGRAALEVFDRDSPIWCCSISVCPT